jgi:hypothetical protein
MLVAADVVPDAASSRYALRDSSGEAEEDRVEVARSARRLALEVLARGPVASTAAEGTFFLGTRLRLEAWPVSAIHGRRVPAYYLAASFLASANWGYALALARIGVSWEAHSGWPTLARKG